MEVSNNQKVQAKTYARNDLRSNVTNITRESGEIQNTLALLDSLLNGSLMGMGGKASALCQKAISDLSQAMQHINQAGSHIDKLKTTEEVPDDEY